MKLGIAKGHIFTSGEAAKKVLFLVVYPLRGGGGGPCHEGFFFEALFKP